MSYKTMKQSQDWRKNYDWTDKNDWPVDEAVEDCKTIPTLNADEPDSPFEDYETNVIQFREVQ